MHLSCGFSSFLARLAGSRRNDIQYMSPMSSQVDNIVQSWMCREMLAVVLTQSGWRTGHHGVQFDAWEDISLSFLFRLTRCLVGPVS